MTGSGMDAYAVVTALPPAPPEDPDPQAGALATRRQMFSQERAAAWTAPLEPARPGRQRHPAPPENRGEPGDTAATERGAMCILDSNGTHVARGLHCPHGLPGPGDPDTVTRVSFTS